MLIDVETVSISATPSNCRESLKLLLPSSGGNTHYGQGNDLGYGKNTRDASGECKMCYYIGTMGNLQPSPKDIIFCISKIQKESWVQFTD